MERTNELFDEGNAGETVTDTLESTLPAEEPAVAEVVTAASDTEAEAVTDPEKTDTASDTVQEVSPTEVTDTAALTDQAAEVEAAPVTAPKETDTAAVQEVPADTAAAALTDQAAEVAAAATEGTDTSVSPAEEPAAEETASPSVEEASTVDRPLTRSQTRNVHRGGSAEEPEVSEDPAGKKEIYEMCQEVNKNVNSDITDNLCKNYKVY